MRPAFVREAAHRRSLCTGRSACTGFVEADRSAKPVPLFARLPWCSKRIPQHPERHFIRCNGNG